MPCLARILWKALATSASMPGQMRSRYSTTVTSAPSRRQTEPSSRPMMPAPMTTRVLGTSENARAPVESTIRSPSTLRPGRPEGSEPVAMMMFLASRVRVLPSAPSTSTRPGPAIRPLPSRRSTLFFFMRKSTPLVRAVTDSSFWAIIFDRFRRGVTSIPRCSNSRLADSKSSEACRRALEGMQPTLRQVPPRVARISMMAAFRPSWPARMAAL